MIPRKVVGKFSIRLVPNQHPDKVSKLVMDYLTSEFEKLESPNKLSVSMAHGGRPWVADYKDPNFVAGRNALKLGQYCNRLKFFYHQ